MRGKTGHFLRWELMEFIRDPHVASWIGGMAVVGYLLAVLLGVWGGTTVLALGTLLSLGPMGLMFLTLGRDGPVRERTWERIIATYPTDGSAVFYGKFLGMMGHAFFYILLVAPGLAWFFWALPGSRIHVLWGLLGYPFLAASMVSVGLALATMRLQNPLRWAGGLVAIFFLAFWVTLISMTDGPFLHTLLVLVPPVAQAHTLDAFPPLDSSRFFAFVVLFFLSSLSLIVASRKLWKRWIAFALGCLLLVSSFGLAAAFAQSVEADPAFNETRLKGEGLSLRLLDPQTGNRIGGPSSPVIGSEPLRVSIELRVPEALESPGTLRISGDHIKVHEAPLQVAPEERTQRFETVLEFRPDLESSNALYILRGELSNEDVTWRGGTFVTVNHPGFKYGLAIASAFGLVPFVLASRRRA